MAVENVYLKGLREQYTALENSIKGYQTRAVEAKRDLTEDELRTVKEQGEKAKALYTQIEDLTDIETRNAKVVQMNAQIQAALSGADGSGPPIEPDVQFRTVGGATTNDRDPGHYRSAKQGGQNSFFRDIYRSKAFGDDEAARRLTEHTRALSTGVAGLGVVPPKWLTEEFELLARQGRILANAVRNIPLGDDPRPMTLPRQTTGADSANPAEQAAENNPVPGADKWASATDTVTPKPTAGKQTVSRQMVDMSDPAIDMLIYGDLIEDFNRQIEAKVGTAVIAAAGAAVTTFATEAGFTAGAAIDSVVDLGIAVRDARKLPATILAMRTRRWGKFKKLKDGSGRPLIPPNSGGPVNVPGVGSINADGIIEDLPVIVTDALGTSAYPESYVALRASDTILFESNILRFRFEEVAGPESVVLGIWGYTAVIVRQNTKSVRRVEITAA